MKGGYERLSSQEMLLFIRSAEHHNQEVKGGQKVQKTEVKL